MCNFFLSNRSCTFPFENRKNIYRFTISPNGLIMISVDEGDIIIIVARCLSIIKIDVASDFLACYMYAWFCALWI